jgi:hypothetical protein
MRRTIPTRQSIFRRPIGASLKKPRFSPGRDPLVVAIGVLN